MRPRLHPTRRFSPSNATRASHSGVEPNGIQVDHGLTDPNRARPGLREALTAGRSGDTLVVTEAL